MQRHALSSIASPVVFALLVCSQVTCNTIQDVSTPTSINALVNGSSQVSKHYSATTLASVTSDELQKRSDDDDDESGKSLFSSLLPISPFKKPIKSLFKSLFEPNPDALRDDSKSSSFYFIKPQEKLTDINHSSLRSKRPGPSSFYYPYRSYAGKHTNRQSNGRSQYSYQRQGRDPPRAFAIGDPENGRGMTISLGDGPQQQSGQYGVATNQHYHSAEPHSEQQPNGGGGRGGFSFSLGGRGGGGSGLSINLGGRGGGSGGGGMSFSLGGGSGGGGSGLSFNMGGGGGEDSIPQQTYAQSSSSNYASYANNQGYGSGSYGSGGYGNYDKSYYPPKPKLSITMPSPGKTVVEANLRPPILKMKLNASPKVKITTGTRDPLEKNHDEEVIMDDIFGPPAPFEKPVKSNGTDDNNGTLSGGFNQTSPYPYPYPYYPGYYPGYYPYGYNYAAPQQPMYSGYYPSAYGYPNNIPPSGYQYGQQYPGTQYATQYNSSYGTSQQSTVFKHSPIELAASASQKKWSIQESGSTRQSYSRPTTLARNQAGYPTSYPASYPITQRPVNTQYRSQSIQPHKTLSTNPHRSISTYQNLMTGSHPRIKVMDHNDISHKRSSASSNYHKDMLTLSSNSIATYSKSKGMPRTEGKNFYHYPKNPTTASVTSASGLLYSRNRRPPDMMGSATDQYSYYAPSGTGSGYSFFNGSSPYNASAAYPNYPNGGYYHPYYNPYYYNYYSNYYNYAKKYYEAYWANMTANSVNQTNSSNSSSYNGYNSRKSISGFSQDQYDHTQSKIFGKKLVRYPGGSTVEEKSRIIMDIRPRVTFRSLNRTQAEEEHRHMMHKKDKDHIFKTRLTILMQSTTPKPTTADYYYGYNSNGYYDDGADEFGYTKASTTPESLTTARPQTTTTRRRTTTTEEPSVSGEDDESSSAERTSQEEEITTTEETTTEESTTSTTETPESEEASSDEAQEEDLTPEVSTPSTTTTTDASSSDDEVIDGAEEAMVDNEESNDDEQSEEQEEKNRSINEEDSRSNDIQAVTIPASAAAGNVTVSPQLVAAMIKALQEALGATPPPVTTTPMPILSTMSSIDRDETPEEDNEIDKENSPDTVTDDPSGDEQETDEPDETESTTTATTRIPKTKSASRTKELTARASRLIPTVFSTVVKNTTQLRLKTPVLNIRSMKGLKQRATSRSKSTAKSAQISNLKKSIKRNTELTTTSPFIIVNKKNGKKSSDVNKLIDGNAIIDSIGLDLTDNERREMLTKILAAVQSKNSANEFESGPNRPTIATTPRSKKTSKSVTKLLPVTKANNVRIVSSLDELSGENLAADHTTSGNKKLPNSPIYVVLLPQDKKKK